MEQNKWFSVADLLRKKCTMYQEQSERRNLSDNIFYYS